jgi:hypothetical protein
VNINQLICTSPDILILVLVLQLAIVRSAASVLVNAITCLHHFFISYAIPDFTLVLSFLISYQTIVPLDSVELVYLRRRSLVQSSQQAHASTHKLEPVLVTLRDRLLTLDHRIGIKLCLILSQRIHIEH